MMHITLKPPRVAYSERNPARVDAKPSERSMFVVIGRTSCSYAIKNNPCRFCAFWDKSPKIEGIAFEDALAKVGVAKGGRIELVGSGSIFDEEQIPLTQLCAMLKLVGRTDAHSVLVESRPEYITAEKIKLARRFLGSKTLEIAIGLETANDSLRFMLNKGFSIWDFHNAVSTIVDAGAIPVAYLLAGIPTMSDYETQCDILESAFTLSLLQKKLGISIRLAIQTFFTSLSLSSLAYLVPEFVAQLAIDVVQKTGMEVFVAPSSEGLTTHPLNSARAQFDLFNATQDILYLIRIKGSK